MRVLAIAQALLSLAAKACPIRSRLAQLFGIPGRDGGIVGCCACIGLGREFPAKRHADLTIGRLHFGQHSIDIAAIGTDGHERAILCSGAQHGRSANVDVFNAGFEVRAGSDGRFEGVEVHVNQVDCANTVRLGIFHMGRIVP